MLKYGSGTGRHYFLNVLGPNVALNLQLRLLMKMELIELIYCLSEVGTDIWKSYATKKSMGKVSRN